MLVAAGAARSAVAAALINEIYWDPPGSVADASHEYVELRGVPGMSLDNHYLLFIENEDNISRTGTAGNIDFIFDLTGRSFGSNGFLTLRQKTDPTSIYNGYVVAPGTTNLQNTGTGIGFGGSAAGSTIGASNSNNNGAPDGRIENSGFTAMLIRNDGDPVANKPTLNFDLDVGNDGLDAPTGRAGWTILDSIGVFAEIGEAETGRTYAPVNFGFETPENTPGFVAADHVPPGAAYVGLGFELEYLARWGNSAGDAAFNWHASNLTDNINSGWTNAGDFRQSGDPHPPGPTGIVETSHGVPYGTNLTNTLGAPNYPLNVSTPTPGDFDLDGDVDVTDLNVEFSRRFGADLDGSALLEWQRAFPLAPGATVAGSAVPEPTGLALCLAAAAGLGRRRLRS